MDKQQTVRIFIQQSQVTRYYNEQEAVALTHLSLQLIQQLYADGLIEGIEVVGEERR